MFVEDCAEVCEICGSTAYRHLIHTADEECYFTSHYLINVLHENVERDITTLEEEKYHH